MKKIIINTHLQMNFLIVISLILLCKALIVNSVVVISPRSGHSSVAINNKLYILGGSSGSTEMYYLDLTESFNVDSIPWQDLTSKFAIPVRVYEEVVSYGGIDNSTIFLLGNGGSNVLYTFNTSTNIWTMPNYNGLVPSYRHWTIPVTDKSGRIFVSGGTNGTTGEAKVYSEIVILDTILHTWTSGSAPFSRYFHTSTILNDGRIVITGGQEVKSNNSVSSANYSSMYEIPVYDTINGTWSLLVGR